MPWVWEARVQGHGWGRAKPFSVGEGGKGMFCQVQRTLHNLHCQTVIKRAPCPALPRRPPAMSKYSDIQGMRHVGVPMLGVLFFLLLACCVVSICFWVRGMAMCGGGLANGGDGGGGSGSDRGLSELPPAGTASLLPLSRGTGWQKQGGGGRYCRGAPRGGGARCLLSPLDWVGAAGGLAGAKVACAARRWRQFLSPILSLRMAWVGDGS